MMRTIYYSVPNNMMSRKLLFALLILAAGLLAACSGKRDAARAESNANRAPDHVEVSTAPVIERSTQQGLEVVGSFEAEDEVTVSSQASGNLDIISVDVGTAVKRGQVIASIDQRELSLKVAQAEASLHEIQAKLGVPNGGKFDPQKQSDVRQARAAMERARYDLTAAQNLVEHGDISKQQQDVYQKTLDQAEARYQAALDNVRNLEAQVEEKRAAVALAKKQLSDTAIVSPINGVIKEKIASRGEYLQPGKPVAIIVQINPLRLKLEVPEAFAAHITRGQTVTLKVDTFPDREFKGIINRINPSVDEKNRSLVAEAEVVNATALLRPGMFARAEIASKVKGTALMVPEKAVVSLAGVNKVFVVEGGRAVERMVKLGRRDGTLVEILEGIKTGDNVVTSNPEQLHDGMEVTAS